jgi:hypothetical protein
MRLCSGADARFATLLELASLEVVWADVRAAVILSLAPYAGVTSK